MVEAVVEFDYVAQESDELTLKKGDVLSEIKTLSGGWWQGLLARTGKRGMFPDNFVKVVDVASNALADINKSTGRKCKVLYSYDPINNDELELKVDDIVEILAEVEEGWWKGKLRGKVGVFPNNFVSEIKDDCQDESYRRSSTASLDELSSKSANAMNHDDSSSSNSAIDSDVPVLPPKPVKEMCKVVYPYEAVNDDELTLQKGDVITLISRDGQDKGWWRGELKGKVGVFPDNFVQVIPSDEITKPARPPVKTNTTTTNRARDSITKSPTTGITPVSSNRKSIEVPSKPDDKLSPPGVSKKPVLPPPPLKKPVGSRSPNSSTANKQLTTSPSYSAETKQNATTPTKPPESPTSNARLPLATNLKQSASSSDVQSSQTDGLKHSTSGPKRSESSDSADGAFLSRNSASYSMSNHTTSETTEQIRSTSNEMDFDSVGRTAMLTHPTASRARAPRRRPPSTINTKESPESGGLMNGNVDPILENEKSSRASFVQELKVSQAKRNSALIGTRVMIGTSTSSSESSTVIESTKISPGVTLRNLPMNLPRPHSMAGGGTGISSRVFNIPPSPPAENISIPTNRLVELMDKITRLESQQEIHQQLIKDLTSKLNEEIERRLQMKLEIEKLTDLITQTKET